jgi:hypothetical protein
VGQGPLPPELGILSMPEVLTGCVSVALLKKDKNAVNIKTEINFFIGTSSLSFHPIDNAIKAQVRIRKTT